MSNILLRAAERHVLLVKYFLNRQDVIGTSCSDFIQPAIYSDIILYSHLTGIKSQFYSRKEKTKLYDLIRAGAYAPAIDNRSKFLCIDFDGPGHSTFCLDPKKAVLAVYFILLQKGFISYIERSRSDRGYHIWVFFKDPLPVNQIHEIAKSVLPSDIKLNTGKDYVVGEQSGIEVFPKSTLKDGTEGAGVGTMVFMPWYQGKNNLYKVENSDLVLYDFKDFTTNSIIPSVSLINTVNLIKDTESSISIWRNQALEKLDLKTIYGEFLVEKESKQEWVKCRDPWSKTKDREPSAGVSTGQTAERGLFHSFITNDNLTVFDFIVKQGIVETFYDACKYIANLTGVLLPSKTNISSNESSPSDLTNGLPVIAINNRQFRDIINDSWEAIKLKTKNVLFRKSGKLVKLMLDDVPSIDFINEKHMHGYLTDSANWVNVTAQGFRSVLPLDKLAENLVYCDHPIKKDIPELESIVCTPMFNCKGFLVNTSGYNVDGKVWFVEDIKISPVPAFPSELEISTAKQWLVDELFVDFPFVSKVDLTHLLAALFLPFVRQLIDGCTPMHVFEAPIPGSGKSLLTDLISIVFMGQECEGRTLSGAEEEVRKSLTAQLARGKPIILLDNISEHKKLESQALASILVHRWWEDRILGQTEMIRLKNDAAWFLTANNPTYSTELSRRIIRIRIDPKQDQPWRRKGFKHENIRKWASENRSRLIESVLTLIQYWISKGRPLSKDILGSFEEWSAIMGGILSCLGYNNFLGNLEEMYEQSDVEGNAWRMFVIKWFELYQCQEIKKDQLLDICNKYDLMEPVIGEGADNFKGKKLILALNVAKDRVIAGFKINCKSGKFNLINTLTPLGSTQTNIEDNSPKGNLVVAKDNFFGE